MKMKSDQQDRSLKNDQEKNETQQKKGMRLAKYLAVHNICSRREAERWIQSGKVCVNGKPVLTPVCFVDSSDTVAVQGKAVPSTKQKKTKIWAYYKPCGEITTHSDPKGRLTVFDSIKRFKIGRVISVGRLDFNSEGLLLLTNDSAFAHSFEKPSQAIKRFYRVRVFGCFLEDLWKRKCQSCFVKNGKTCFVFKNFVIGSIRYGPSEISFSEDSAPLAKKFETRPGNFWCDVQLQEGKNLEIRRIMKFFGLQVNRLIRIQYGPFRLGNLQPGQIRQVEFNPDWIRE